MTDSIAEVKFREDYEVVILLKSGHQLLYDMNPRLVTARFRDLTDFRLFAKGVIVHSGKIIKWNENTEISIEEIMLQATEEMDEAKE